MTDPALNIVNIERHLKHFGLDALMNTDYLNVVLEYCIVNLF